MPLLVGPCTFEDPGGWEMDGVARLFATKSSLKIQKPYFEKMAERTSLNKKNEQETETLWRAN